MREVNESKVSDTKRRKNKRMQKILGDLRRRYPNNRYSIVEVECKKHKISVIRREKEVGRRHHRIKHKDE
jgi:hypothetical protein